VQDSGRQLVLARVDRLADADVGVDRIEPLVLQRISLDLLEEADAPALVERQIDENAVGRRRNPPQRGFELRAAVAAERMKDVARDASRMHAHERNLGRLRAFAVVDQGHGLGVLVLALVGARLEHDLAAVEIDRQHGTG